MNRRTFLTGMATAAAASAVPLVAESPSDPAMALAEQWLALEPHWGWDLTDEQVDDIGSRQGELAQRLLETPARSVAGIKAKLRVLTIQYGPTTPDIAGDPRDFCGDMLLSLLADAERLA